MLCMIMCIGSNVRLSQGRQGRVELLYRNRWGTVCDNGWDDTDAGVVCRQLGFGSSGTAIGSAGFGEGSGPIWLDNVLCTGSEPTVAGCGHFGVNITRNCSHSEDAGVRCNETQGMYSCSWIHLLKDCLVFFSCTNAFG